MKKILSLALCLVMGAGMQQVSAFGTKDVVNAKVGTSVAVGLAGAIGGMYAQYRLTLPEGDEATFKGFIQYLTTTGHIAEALAIGAAVGGVTYVGYGKLAEKVHAEKVHAEKVHAEKVAKFAENCALKKLRRQRVANNVPVII